MPVAILPPLCVDPEFCVVSRWNLSLPARTRWRIFGLLAAVSLTLASAFVAAGAWMVLPYSLVELGVLAFAFRYIERRAMDWERLTVAGRLGLPQVLCPGALEVLVFNEPHTVPPQFQGRTLVRHSPKITDVRLDREEMAAVGREVARRLGFTSGDADVAPIGWTGC